MRNKVSPSEQKRRAAVATRRQDKAAKGWALAFEGLSAAPLVCHPEVMTPRARAQLMDAWEKICRAWDPVIRECRRLRDGSIRNDCPQCSKPFTPARTDQRFCSGRCRQAAYRARLGE